MEFEKIIRDIHNLIKKHDSYSLNIAKHIAFLEHNKYYGIYKDIYELCDKEFGYKKKTVNTFLNVIYFFFEYNEKGYPNGVLYFAKEGFKDFNYSQLKSMLNLDSDTIFNVLNITSELSVREIEKRRSQYLKNVFKTENALSGCSDGTADQPSNAQRFLDNDIVMSFSNGLCDCTYNDKKYNVNTSLKILRTLIEENTQDQYTYVVVRVPKRD